MKAGWESTTVGSLSEVVTKGTTPTSVGHKFTETGINFIKVESLGEHGQCITNKLAHISEDCHEALRRSQIKEGDILFSIAGALGRTVVVPADILPANTNQALSIIRLKNDAPIHRPFLVYALSSGTLIEQIEKARGGVAQQNLSLAQVKAFNIPLPPLEEQRKIVAILDEAFEGLDRAEENLKENLLSANDLFSSRVRHLFWSGSNQRDWRIKTIGALCSIKTGKKDVNQGNPKGQFPFFTCARKHTYSDEYSFEGEAILIAGNGEVGNLNHYVGKFEAYQRTYVLMGFSDVIPRFLFFVLLGELQNHLFDRRMGNTIPYIKKGMLTNFEIPVPPMGEQVKILGDLERLFDASAQVVELYQRKQNQLLQLRKSLLQKAFAGELT